MAKKKVSETVTEKIFLRGAFYEVINDPEVQYELRHQVNKSKNRGNKQRLLNLFSLSEMVREQMLDIIERYGFVTVADVYDMADLTAPYTSNKYGWTNIRNAETMRLRDGGFVLKLPKAMPID